MLNALAAPLMRLYEGVLSLRNDLYERGVFRERRLPVPVVSVGSLTVGGVGKTPAAECVARLLHARMGKRVCVLSRGYGRSRKASDPVVVSDGERLRASWSEAGDEPLVLAENLLGCASVVVCPSRVKGGALAVDRLGAEAVVLDDGFQHRALARDANLLLVDGRDFLGNERLFPRGPLREQPSAIRRADAVLFTRTPQGAEEAAAAWLRARAPGTPHFFCELRAGDATWKEPPAEAPKRIAALCGLARPAQFQNTLRSLGYDVALWKEFPDHHRYERADVAPFLEEARRRGAAALLTTQKDWVKVRELKKEWPLPAGFVRLHASVRKEDEFLKFLGEKSETEGR
jgi:tetraacyldisaccharide 4'-kinase